MTTILNSLTPVACEVTYDAANLFVALKSYKLVLGNWIQVGAAVPALLAGINNTYVGMFAPLSNDSFMVELMVYTDNTYTTPQAGYYPSSRVFTVDTSLTATLSSIQSILTSLSSVITSAVNPAANIESSVSVGGEIIGEVFVEDII